MGAGVAAGLLYSPAKLACQCRSNPLPSVFWQYIHTNLPHIFAICGTGGQSNQRISIVCADPEDIQLLAVFTKRIAPFWPIQFPKIFLFQYTRFISTGKNRYPVYIRQIIFCHKAYFMASLNQSFVQPVHIWRVTLT